jgi:RNA polymerase sigma-70 factor, ECF subfamily
MNEALNRDVHRVRMIQRDDFEREDGYNIRSRLIELMDRYEQPLYKFAFVLAGDHASASDCAQEAFVRAYENLRRGKPVNGHWLYTVARNLVMDEFRHRRRLTGESALAVVSEEGLAMDVRACMREAFAQLAPDDRIVLYLLAVEGRSTEEIASILSVRRGAARMRICRARGRFRLAYGESA